MRVNASRGIKTRFNYCLVSLAFLSCTATSTLLAQNLEDPDELFYSLLDDGRTFQAAVAAVDDRFGVAVGAELAAYICAPDADEICQGSEVDVMWIDFLDIIYEGTTVYDTFEAMLESGYDEAYLTAIAVNWCSPEPEAGEGCGDDPFAQSWTLFENLLEKGIAPDEALEQIYYEDYAWISELIGAAVCGHPSCYASEEGLEFGYLEESEPVLQAAKPAPIEKSSTRRYVGTLRKTRSFRSKVCGIFSSCK